MLFKGRSKRPGDFSFHDMSWFSQSAESDFRIFECAYCLSLTCKMTAPRRVAFSEVGIHSYRLLVGSAMHIRWDEYLRIRFIDCVLSESDRMFLHITAWTWELECAFGILP